MKRRAKAVTDKEMVLLLALKRIAQWDFAGDGRKFSGNHKEIVKHICGIAKDALCAAIRQQKRRRG